MITFIEKVEELTEIIKQYKINNKTIGFVPTMGALHQGHVSLVKRSKQENKICIVSIFVNPTQFNDKKDLKKYVRDIDGDLNKLASSGVDIVFAPSVSEIYPDTGDAGPVINLCGLDTYMEGAFRPGHFKGVAQVVKRLLDIVTPDKLYMGQKDFQQFTIINHMIKTLHIQTELVVCPIIREPNGLAMSSRNERLTPATREKAGIIYKCLQSIKKNQNKKSISDLCNFGIKKLNVYPFQTEYLIISDGNTLKPLNNIEDTDYAVACVAVFAEGVRLIDNIILKQGH
ncbi:MAG: pantoate--beta-alanine ligase [Saprospiraceae bacterium]|nr:pantoate--beta-alanine ligase [Saprospiraceae bacterium]